ncbi:MAG: GNAT family N-acetyltransferase [Clostridiales Family XIII bacterium]|jgi:GNAT superfamily N-acetyltransferase|nr:GNAT family N-acetyltransferase [Clostridiales Family XIII bacterium]
MTEIRPATLEDFDLAFDYIEKLWTYNTYDRDTVLGVYKNVLEGENDFAFFLFDDGKPMGFCHGTFFNTFWLSGQTCYVSSIITNADVRKKGYGRQLMDHAKSLAEARGCHAIVLDSGLPREEAHKFYEIYGFEKCAYCFELKL